MVVPVVSKDVQRQIDSCVARYKDATKWRLWGLDSLRQQGSCFLLWGPPGTGKSVLAAYISLKVRKKGMKELNFANFGSHVPGENSRQIRRLFQEAKQNGGMTIFLDECDAVLWSRDRIGDTNTWMLEVIDELLLQISKYEHLVILATNRADMLDAGVISRCLAVIEVTVPEFPERIKLWDKKWPRTYPLELSASLHNKLAEYVLTGREIENVILRVSGEAIAAGRKPTEEDFCNVTTEIAEAGRKARVERYAPRIAA